MGSPITSIRNFGPAMEQACARAGLTTAEELHALGTDALYRRLLSTGTQPHFIGYYVIEMGLQGRPWNDCKGKEKAALRARFDAIVAEAKATNLVGIERILNEIGVVPAGVTSTE